MNRKLLKIAAYLGRQGLYQEAAQIKKIAELPSDMMPKNYAPGTGPRTPPHGMDINAKQSTDIPAQMQPFIQAITWTTPDGWEYQAGEDPGDWTEDGGPLSNWEGCARILFKRSGSTGRWFALDVNKRPEEERAWKAAMSLGMQFGNKPEFFTQQLANWEALTHPENTHREKDPTRWAPMGLGYHNVMNEE